MILYYLSERKQGIADLSRNINEIEQNVNLTTITNTLEFAGFVEKDGDFFKINIEALFS